MRRIEALRRIDEVFAGSPIVATVGATSRELASVARRPSHLYLLDSMGLAGSVGAGLALGLDRPVAVIEGDGSLLMGLSILPTLAYHRPPRLSFILLDNHQHASAAGMPSQAERIDLAALCRGSGLTTVEVDDPDGLVEALRAARQARGPSVVVASIEPGNSDGVPFLLDDPAVIAHEFRAFLGRT
jgi:sulfopyruvate decarboxylase subunit beta